ncbi:Membrane-associated phospholipid phosphatase [Halanaeroarchaeum sp. HSR-CO]|uniref:phosphatase PAP2 family protein n=1 Tax=Halanaeroarchaeum sp. HSR-CO TaxID=2866382 RepID=UPI00217E340C|nr:phosphatase PAP2 family protein [Halanaeroarchaeum sp. HSR-CO]UWG46605.1 Membrane-associated phospholipid phosphatase [Halanaeroarchaeum sp. HSR-CO]
MILFRVIASMVLVVGGMLAVTAYAAVGRDRIRSGIGQWRTQVRETWRYVAVLAVVLGVNKFARVYGPRISWLLDWNLTPYIYRLEGEFVVWVQSFASPSLTAALGFVYLYGYAYLLIFPLLGYFLLNDSRAFKQTVVAYTLNYAVGVVIYTLFVSFGPRNVDLVTGLLFTEYPEAMLVTWQVNSYTNVFPSLHTSLATTVALLAWITRDRLPRWPPIAIPLAVGVVVSTMYLGIHWATDVIAGIALAAFSVVAAGAVVRRVEG